MSGKLKDEFLEKAHGADKLNGFYLRFILIFLPVFLLFSGCSQPANVDGATSGIFLDTFRIMPPQLATFIPDSIKGTIYLTFDDGPLYGSENVSNIIEKEKIMANVFVVGKHAESNKKLMDFYKLYLDNPFIEIGNHSYTHAAGKYQQFYSNTSITINDFEKCQRDLKIPTKLARLPGRNQWRLNTISKNDIRSGIYTSDSLHKIGFKIYGWDIEWNKNSKTGNPKQTVDYMVDLIERKLADSTTVKPGHIILLAHDEMFRNSGASELQQLIERLKATNSYAFAHLSKYPG